MRHEADCCDSDTLAVHYCDSGANRVFTLFVRLLAFSRLWLEWRVFFFLKGKKNWPLFVSLFFPHSFLSAVAQRGPVFSLCAFGSGLITYLFGLSYSKHHWLCVSLRAETFLPPVLSTFHRSCWPPTAVADQASRRAKFVFRPPPFAVFCWPIPSHFIARRPHACNSLQRSRTCPPPIVTCYKSSGSKRQPRFASTPAAVSKLNLICPSQRRPVAADSYQISTTRCSQWKAFTYCCVFMAHACEASRRAGSATVGNDTEPTPVRFNILQSGCQKSSEEFKACESRRCETHALAFSAEILFRCRGASDAHQSALLSEPCGGMRWMRCVCLGVYVYPAGGLRPEFYLVIGSRSLCQAPPLDLKTITQPLPKVYIRPRSQPTLRPTQYNLMESPDTRPVSVEILQYSGFKVNLLHILCNKFTLMNNSSPLTLAVFSSHLRTSRKVLHSKNKYCTSICGPLFAGGCCPVRLSVFDFASLSSHPVSRYLGVTCLQSFDFVAKHFHFFPHISTLKDQSVLILWFASPLQHILRCVALKGHYVVFSPSPLKLSMFSAKGFFLLWLFWFKVHCILKLPETIYNRS